MSQTTRPLAEHPRRERSRPARPGEHVKLTIRLLGTEVLHIETGEQDAGGEWRGDCTTYPVGFAPSAGDQRYESGADL